MFSLDRAAENGTFAFASRVFIPLIIPLRNINTLMYGYQLIRTFERLHDLGLTPSRKSFSKRWCGKSGDLLRDYGRRSGAAARVSPKVVARIRQRLAEAATLLPEDVAEQVREIDAAIVRDIHIADLLGRRAFG